MVRLNSECDVSDHHEVIDYGCLTVMSGGISLNSSLIGMNIF